MSKFKKKVKVRESHRVFVRKTIHEAKDQIDKSEEPNALKKLKSLRCTLQDKLSELKTLDNEILDLVDESKIEENVGESCDFASAIQACIVDLELAIDAKTNEGKSQEGKERFWVRSRLIIQALNARDEIRRVNKQGDSCKAA